MASGSLRSLLALQVPDTRSLRSSTQAPLRHLKLLSLRSLLALQVPDKELKEQLCSLFTRDLQDSLTCQVDLKVPPQMLIRCLIRCASGIRCS